MWYFEPFIKMWHKTSKFLICYCSNQPFGWQKSDTFESFLYFGVSSEFPLITVHFNMPHSKTS